LTAACSSSSPSTASCASCSRSPSARSSAPSWCWCSRSSSARAEPPGSTDRRRLRRRPRQRRRRLPIRASRRARTPTPRYGEPTMTNEGVKMSAEFSGIGVVPGRVVAPARVMPPPVTAPVEQPAPQDPEADATRIREASAAVHAELLERAETVTGDAQDVLQATAPMARDPTLIKTAIKRLTATDAETAVWTVAEDTAAQLEALGGYMAERAADVLDVRARLVARLRGVPAPGIPHSEEPFVLIADDLAPADTATLDPESVVALVCAAGGPQSHTAILARSLGIPAIVAAAGVLDVADHTPVFVDGGTGVLRTEPGTDEADLVA